MRLSAAQIFELASDAASRKAGQDQARPGKWEGAGRAGTLVWGEIKGSGTNPYRTVCDLGGPALNCTCPSRKFPCKHALGLLLLDNGAPLADGTPPDWAQAWLLGREARAARQADTTGTEKPANEQAQLQRQQARADRVSDALDELELWLCDLMRRGLASLRGEPYAFWDRMAGRLVDGQAPGLARRVRAMPGLLAAAPMAGAHRGDAALALEIGRLGLLLRGARRMQTLPGAQVAQLRATIGYPVGAVELAAAPDRTDRWTVLAHTAVADAGGLTARSVWLAGRDGGAMAQVIDFGTPGAPLPPVPRPGQDFIGALGFYSGAPALRAVFRTGRATASLEGGLPGGAGIAAALHTHAAALAQAPWTQWWPLRLTGVRFGYLGSGTTAGFGVGDETGCLALRDGPYLPALLAVAGDHPIELFGLYDGAGLTPLALVAEGRLFTVPLAQDARPVLVRAT